MADKRLEEGLSERGDEKFEKIWDAALHLFLLSANFPPYPPVPPRVIHRVIHTLIHTLSTGLFTELSTAYPQGYPHVTGWRKGA
jgi:hypothetical protein